MVTLEQLRAMIENAQAAQEDPFLALDALLLPMDTAVAHFPVVNLTTIIAGYLKLGQPVRVNHDIDEGEWVRVTEGDEKKFIGLAIIKDGLVAPKRVVVDYSAQDNT